MGGTGITHARGGSSNDHGQAYLPVPPTFRRAEIRVVAEHRSEPGV